jgi:hypothetical protein
MAGTVNSLALLLGSLIVQAESPQQRDPTRAPTLIVHASNTATLSAQLQLTLVRFEGVNAFAWINERKLTVGDTIEGARVEKIDTHGVTLLRNGEKERLLLAPNVLIKTPKLSATFRPHSNDSAVKPQP